MKKIRILFAAATISLSLIGCGPSAEKVNTALSEGEYKEAVTSFNKLNEEDKKKLAETFKAEAENIKSEYIAGTMDKITAISALTEIKLVKGMEEIADNVMIFINKIEDSRNAFNSGNVAETSQDWVKALEEYAKIVQEDVKNYDVAKAKIEEITKKLEDSILVTVDSASIMIQHDTYKALYPDKMCAIFTNKSDQAIKNIEIGFLAWDSNNFPLKIKGQFSFGNESFEYVGLGENINVIPGGTYGDNYGWDLDENHGISTLKANVRKVEFYDGTTWTNPLYNSWLDQYKEKPLTN